MRFKNIYFSTLAARVLITSQTEVCGYPIKELRQTEVCGYPIKELRQPEVCGYPIKELTQPEVFGYHRLMMGILIL